MLRTRLTALAAAAVLVAPARADDRFDAMRVRWQETLVGAAALDRRAPDVAAQLASQAAAARRALAGMHAAPDAPVLWDDIAGFDDPYPIKASGAVSATAERLALMARAYAAPGSPAWHDRELGQGIAAGLDWLVRNKYSAGRRQYGNWWSWQIGAPLHLLDVLSLAGDALPEALRRQTLAAVDWYVPDARFKTRADGSLDTARREDGANLLDKALVVILSGMLAQDAERIAAGRDAIGGSLDYATEGNGFYRDGSFIQHKYVPYNGSYGAVALADYARLLHLLSGSDWALADPRAPRIFHWARQAFAELIVDGAMPDAFRGRAIARRRYSDHAVGRAMAGSLAVIAQAAPPAERAALRSLIKKWMQRDRSFGADYLGKAADAAQLPLHELGLLKEIAADPDTPPAAEAEGIRIFASMDRAILRGKGFAAVLSMTSPRTSSFETGNRENLRGWWTGMGVLNLYDADQAQYGPDYWPTVDQLRLPGTTTDRSGSGPVQDWKQYPNPESWVGGAALGKYAALGMAFSMREVTGSSLHGRKSWFQLGDRILALGSGIGGGSAPAETIVENRRLADVGGARLLVDGRPLANGRVGRARWAHLHDDRSGSRIGYVFPLGAALTAERSQRSGAWRDINALSGDPELRRHSYQVLAIPHGVPDYAYLLLPKASVAQTRAAAASPGLRIEANDAQAAAVSLPAQGVYAANLWQAGSAPRAGRAYVWSSAPVAVVAARTGARLRLAIAEPTQRVAALEVTFGEAASAVVRLGPGVTVLALAPRLRLRIDSADAAGAGFEAEVRLAGAR